MVDAMGQSRPSLCQCCTANSGATGDEVSLQRTRCQEPWSRTPDVPEWMKALSPAFDSSQAILMLSAWEQFHEDLKRRTKHFVETMVAGLPCRVVNGPGKCTTAKATLDLLFTTLTISDCESALQQRCFWLADTRNLWLCSDSELARRAHQALAPFAVAEEAELACLVLLDGASQPLPLLLRSSEAREDFLDCMSVLIAAHRQRLEKDKAGFPQPSWLPKPDLAGLRQYGCSLRSCHLAGPLGAWLATCAPLGQPVQAQSYAAPESPCKGFKASAKSKSRARAASISIQPFQRAASQESEGESNLGVGKE